MDIGGLVLVDKPLGWSSFEVVRFIKNRNKLKKVGHVGTLDPLATGLLILCYGTWTKKIKDFQNLKKTYTGIITLGKTTPSFDAETEFNFIDRNFKTSQKEILETRDKFLGEITQIPPIYSALKFNGKRLYQIARNRENKNMNSLKQNTENIINNSYTDIVIRPRQVFISKFEIDKIEMPDIYFTIECSKGTYIRSIANDFGQLLKSGAYLSKLRRTKIGDYKVEDAINLEETKDK